MARRRERARSTSCGRATNAITGAGDVIWLPNRRRLGRQETTYWNYKVLGRYVFPYDFGLSASYKLQSGYNWARNTSVALPNAGSESILMEPLSANRTANVHILDFRVEKGFRIGRGGKVTGMMDLFNALNQNPIVGFRTVTGPDTRSHRRARSSAARLAFVGLLNAIVPPLGGPKVRLPARAAPSGDLLFRLHAARSDTS